jgi:hypothetical protein
MTLITTSVVSIGWTLTMVVTGLIAHVESLGWVAVSVLAFGPSMALMHFGKELALTTSRVVDEAKR